MAITDTLSAAERNLEGASKVPFFKFVLTGGPCAGMKSLFGFCNASFVGFSHMCFLLPFLSSACMIIWTPLNIGKTTALARIYSYLRERGFEVITCPETFTILASNGMSLDFFATEGMYVSFWMPIE